MTGVLRRDGVESKRTPMTFTRWNWRFSCGRSTAAGCARSQWGRPRQSAAVLEALYMGADGGAVISDRRFAGADVLATSYTLAQDCAAWRLLT